MGTASRLIPTRCDNLSPAAAKEVGLDVAFLDFADAVYAAPFTAMLKAPPAVLQMKCCESEPCCRAHV